MHLAPCTYRSELPPQRNVFRCRHPNVHAKDDLVGPEVCNVCSLSRPQTSHLARIAAARDRKIIRGRSTVPALGRPTYECDVVIAYYQNLQWLVPAIESLLCQVDVRCHLHLVNDCSPEDDGWIRKRYRAVHNIDWYRNVLNIGPYRSVHRVWRYLRTAHLAIQDSDDIALPTRLWRSIHSLTQSGADIYGASLEQFADPGSTLTEEQRHYLARAPIIASGIKLHSVPFTNIINCTFVCRRDLFERLNGFADVYVAGDTEFTARAHLADAVMFIDENVVGLRRVHHGNMSLTGMHVEERAMTGQRIREMLAKLERGGGRLDLRQFGALDPHRWQPGTERISRPLERIRRPVLRELARVECGPSSGFWRYLIDHGLVGATARRAPALLPLERYASFRHFSMQVSPHVRRDAAKARKLGCYVREFRPDEQKSGLMAIVRSRPERQGRPMADRVTGALRAERAGLDEPLRPGLQDPQDRSRWFGVFIGSQEYGPRTPTQQESLVAFINVRRCGELASYGRILGHAAHLKHGIMFLLHLELMERILARTDEGLRGVRYLMYGAWEDSTDGLRIWKSRAGFSPHYLLPRSPIAAEPVEERGSFPKYVLAHAESAAAFFCAGFGGRNDVVHLQKHSLGDVTLIDHDVDKMAALQQRCDPAWRYIVADAFDAAAELRQSRTYDVVTCDAWTNQFEDVALCHLDNFLALAKRYLLITLVPHWADEKGYGAHWFASQHKDVRFYRAIRDCFQTQSRSAIIAELTAVLTRYHGRPVKVCDIVRRNDYLKGCYWLVIESS